MNDLVESSRADLPFALPPADDGLAAFFSHLLGRHPTKTPVNRFHLQQPAYVQKEHV